MDKGNREDKRLLVVDGYSLHLWIGFLRFWSQNRIEFTPTYYTYSTTTGCWNIAVGWRIVYGWVGKRETCLRKQKMFCLDD